MKITKNGVFKGVFDIPDGLRGFNLEAFNNYNAIDKNLVFARSIDFKKQTIIRVPEINSDKFEIFKNIPYELDYVECNIIGEGNIDNDTVFINCDTKGEPFNLRMNKNHKVYGHICEPFVNIEIGKNDNKIDLKIVETIFGIGNDFNTKIFEYNGEINKLKIPKHLSHFENAIVKCIIKSLDANKKIIHFYTNVEKHSSYDESIVELDKTLYYVQNIKNKVIKSRIFNNVDKMNYNFVLKIANNLPSYNLLGEESTDEFTSINCDLSGNPLDFKMDEKGKICGFVKDDYIEIFINTKKKGKKIKIIKHFVKNDAQKTLYEINGRMRNLEDVKLPENLMHLTNVIEKSIEKSFDENIKNIHFYADVEKHPNYESIIKEYDEKLKQEYIDKLKKEIENEKIANNKLLIQELKDRYKLCKDEVIELIYEDVKYIPNGLKHKELNDFETIIYMPKSKYKLLTKINGEFKCFAINLFGENIIHGDSFTSASINFNLDYEMFDNDSIYNEKNLIRTSDDYINVNAITLHDSIKITVKEMLLNIPYSEENILYEFYDEDINNFDITTVDETYREMVYLAYEKSFK